MCISIFMLSVFLGFMCHTSFVSSWLIIPLCVLLYYAFSVRGVFTFWSSLIKIFSCEHRILFKGRNGFLSKVCYSYFCCGKSISSLKFTDCAWVCPITGAAGFWLTREKCFSDTQFWLTHWWTANKCWRLFYFQTALQRAGSCAASALWLLHARQK